MPKATSHIQDSTPVTRDRLAELLNEDLSREYQGIIEYVVYSQGLEGPEYMSIADQLALHARQQLGHALIIARQIYYLGAVPTATPNPVKTSENARDMLRFDLTHDNETIRNYRERVRQCEELEEFNMAEQIREILIDEQDHQVYLATASAMMHQLWRIPSSAKQPLRRRHSSCLRRPLARTSGAD